MNRESRRWTPIEEILGTSYVPRGAALIIEAAVKKAVKSGDITYRNRWQLIEWLCAEYINE